MSAESESDSAKAQFSITVEDRSSIQESYQHERPSTHNILNHFPKECKIKTVRTNSHPTSGRTWQLETLNALKAWASSKSTVQGARNLSSLISSLFQSQTPRPTSDVLISIAESYFPQRVNLPVTIFDFGPSRTERQSTTIGTIQDAFNSKPPWATVRWIHAPLGVGLFHSVRFLNNFQQAEFLNGKKTVEDLFRYSGTKEMGRPFEKAGRAGWPYLEIEMLNLRGRPELQEMSDVFHLLQGDSEVKEALDGRMFEHDYNPRLQTDIRWREEYTKQKLDYWGQVKSNFPWHLFDGSHIHTSGPLDGSRKIALRLDEHTLQQHPFYQDAYLARDCFRAFHRSDGYLLTLSSAQGINYINNEAPELLKDPFGSSMLYGSVQSIEQIFEEFRDNGTDQWHQKHVEWLLVYIITEISGTPNSLREGFNAPCVMDAYESIVSDLKERKFDPWKRGETVQLFRKYLACIDELRSLQRIYEKKLTFLNLLMEDCKLLQQLDDAICEPPNNPSTISMTRRVQFAMQLVNEANIICKDLLEDLNDSQGSLFQLRSIEQNDLSIVADSQNKAIFLFTGVTIIFLPLSFFTSYFGMNINGIRDTSYDQADFWTLCGTITSVTFFVILIYTLKQQLTRQLRPAMIRR